MVWIFNNTRQSVFATILFHTMNNAAFAVLPVNTIVSTLVFAIAAIFVTLLWGPETMAEFRWKTGRQLVVGIATGETKE